MSPSLPARSFSDGVEVRFSGNRVWPTLQWAAAVLVRSPVLIVVAIVASSLELFFSDGDPLRWLASAVAVLLVTALAAIVAEDALDGRDRAVVSRLKDAVVALPRLAIAFALFVVALFFGAFLPIALIRFLGVLLAFAVVLYLLALFSIVFPAVVIDGSMSDGRAAFVDNRLLVVGLLIVVAIARAPVALVSPTLEEPVIAVALAVWAGVLTGLSTLAYARVYLANRSHTNRSRMSGSGSRPATKTSADGWTFDSSDSGL
ncbi:MAG: hypothetical protein ACOCQY_01415 [Halorhabdus sp.]